MANANLQWHVYANSDTFFDPFSRGHSDLWYFLFEKPTVPVMP